MRALWFVWALLTGLAAVICTMGCLLPYWLKGYVQMISPVSGLNELQNDESQHLEIKVGLPTDLGLFRRCGYPTYSHSTFHTTSDSIEPVTWETGCGHYSHISQVPHIAWYIAFFTLIIACGLLCFNTFFLFMLGFALYLISSKLVCRSCQLIQILSGVLVTITCLLYPLGWARNSEIEQVCGPEASSFQLGRCHIGWAYVLTLAGGLLSLFAAALPLIFPTHLDKSSTDKHLKADNAVFTPGPGSLLLIPRPGVSPGPDYIRRHSVNSLGAERQRYSAAGRPWSVITDQSIHPSNDPLIYVSEVAEEEEEHEEQHDGTDAKQPQKQTANHVPRFIVDPGLPGPTGQCYRSQSVHGLNTPIPCTQSAFVPVCWIPQNPTAVAYRSGAATDALQRKRASCIM